MVHISSNISITLWTPISLEPNVFPECSAIVRFKADWEDRTLSICCKICGPSKIVTIKMLWMMILSDRLFFFMQILAIWSVSGQVLSIISHKYWADLMNIMQFCPISVSCCVMCKTTEQQLWLWWNFHFPPAAAVTPYSNCTALSHSVSTANHVIVTRFMDSWLFGKLNVCVISRRTILSVWLRIGRLRDYRDRPLDDEFLTV